MAKKISTANLIQSLLDRTRDNLSQRRYLHVMGVTHAATVLAACHRIDAIKATLAGLLHDLCKEVHPKVIRVELRDLDVEIPADDLDFPRIWHGLHAATIAESQFGLSDPELLEAVTLHTTSEAGVSDLTKLLFVADFTEPGRKIEAAPEIFELAKRDLQAGYREALVTKMRHVIAKRGEINQRGWRALEEVCPDQRQQLLTEAAVS